MPFDNDRDLLENQLLKTELKKLDDDFKVTDDAEKFNTPENFRDVIAILKFDDIGPIKALGYFCNSEDSKELCFVVHAGRCAYIADLVEAWRYLDDAPHSYIPLRKNKPETSEAPEAHTAVKNDTAESDFDNGEPRK